jgi:hypothetical protein
MYSWGFAPHPDSRRSQAEKLGAFRPMQFFVIGAVSRQPAAQAVFSLRFKTGLDPQRLSLAVVSPTNQLTSRSAGWTSKTFKQHQLETVENMRWTHARIREHALVFVLAIIYELASSSGSGMIS